MCFEKKINFKKRERMAKMKAPFWIKITLDYWQKKSENAQFYRHVLRTKSILGEGGGKVETC